MNGSVRWFSLAIIGCVSSQGIYEEHNHQAHQTTLDIIPKQFEVRDIPPSNPSKDFAKYAESIHHLAKKENLSVVYKITVKTIQRVNPRGSSKRVAKKAKGKKFLVPLKKNSMKLSNFEVFLRRAAEQNHFPPQGGSINSHSSSTFRSIQTTKIPHLKFKPIKSKLRNFTKVIRPVRNNIITLS